VELLVGQSSGFKNVNQLSPDVGEHFSANALLPGAGRLIKTHELYLDSYEKAIYLVRDPRDVAISEYAYQKALGVRSGDFEHFLNDFLRKGVNPFGLWTKHVNSWLEAAEAKRCQVLTVRYEDLRLETEKSLRQMMNFLNVTVDSATIRKAIENNSLEQMRAKEKVSPQRASANGRFVRSGSISGWKEKLTPSQMELFDQHAGEVMANLGYTSATPATLDEVRA